MTAVILAGGLGTRLAEETVLRPKPMIEIGGRPMLWHIMTGYARHGITRFVVCLGYKGDVIKDYFVNYGLRNADLTVDLADGRVVFHENRAESWSVTLVDTGLETNTGGRLRRVRRWLGDGAFCCTYGDAVSDVDIGALVAGHRAGGARATLTAVRPAGRFGALALDGGRVVRFDEKPPGDGNWISGGFFVLEPSALDLIEGDGSSWEYDVLPGLAARGELGVHRHDGFWQCLDTPRDKQRLEELWSRGDVPWLAPPR